MVHLIRGFPRSFKARASVSTLAPLPCLCGLDHKDLSCGKEPDPLSYGTVLLDCTRLRPFRCPSESTMKTKRTRLHFAIGSCRFPFRHGAARGLQLKLVRSKLELNGREEGIMSKLNSSEVQGSQSFFNHTNNCSIGSNTLRRTVTNQRFNCRRLAVKKIEKCD